MAEGEPLRIPDVSDKLAVVDQKYRRRDSSHHDADRKLPGTIAEHDVERDENADGLEGGTEDEGRPDQRHRSLLVPRLLPGEPVVDPGEHD